MNQPSSGGGGSSSRGRGHRGSSRGGSRGSLSAKYWAGRGGRNHGQGGGQNNNNSNNNAMVMNKNNSNYNSNNSDGIEGSGNRGSHQNRGGSHRGRRGGHGNNSNNNNSGQGGGDAMDISSTGNRQNRQQGINNNYNNSNNYNNNNRQGGGGNNNSNSDMMDLSGASSRSSRRGGRGGQGQGGGGQSDGDSMVMDVRANQNQNQRARRGGRGGNAMNYQGGQGFGDGGDAMDLSGASMGRGNRGSGRGRGGGGGGGGAGERMEVDNSHNSFSNQRGRGRNNSNSSSPFGTSPGASGGRGRAKQSRDVMMQDGGDGSPFGGGSNRGRGNRQQNQNHMMVENNNFANQNNNINQQQQSQRGGKQAMRGGRGGKGQGPKLMFDPVTHDVSMEGNVIGARASVFDAKRQQKQQFGANRDAAMSDLSPGLGSLKGFDPMGASPKKARSPFAVAERNRLFKDRPVTPAGGVGRGASVFQTPVAKFQEQKKKNSESIFRLNKQQQQRDQGGNVDMGGEEDYEQAYGDGGEQQEDYDGDEVEFVGQTTAKFTRPNPLRGSSSTSVSSGKFEFRPTMGYNAIKPDKPKIFQFNPVVLSEEEESGGQGEEDYEQEDNYDDENDDYDNDEGDWNDGDGQEESDYDEPTPPKRQSTLSAAFSTSKRQTETAVPKPAATQAKPAASAGGEIKTRGRGGSKFTDEDKFGHGPSFLDDDEPGGGGDPDEDDDGWDSREDEAPPPKLKQHASRALGRKQSFGGGGSDDAAVPSLRRNVSFDDENTGSKTKFSITFGDNSDDGEDPLPSRGGDKGGRKSSAEIAANISSIKERLQKERSGSISGLGEKTTLSSTTSNGQIDTREIESTLNGKYWTLGNSNKPQQKKGGSELGSEAAALKRSRRFNLGSQGDDESESRVSTSQSSKFQRGDQREHQRILRKVPQEAPLSPNSKRARRYQYYQTAEEEAEGPLEGTCPTMCPPEEMRFRQEQKALVIFEKYPGTENDPFPYTNEELCVKEFKKIDAIVKNEARNVRPFPVLKRTMDYLLTDVVSDDRGQPYHVLYSFICDRIRSIFQDLTVQHLNKSHPEETMSFFEKAIRFFIFSDQILCEEPGDNHDLKLQKERLNKALISLMKIYEDLGLQHIYTGNEPEFVAYHMLMCDKENHLKFILGLPDHVRKSEIVQFVLKVKTAIALNNCSAFFKLFNEADLLMASLMHNLYFEPVRKRALETFHKTMKGAVELSFIKDALNFDEMDDAIEFLYYYGIDVVDNNVEFTRIENGRHVSCSLVIPIEGRPRVHSAKLKEELLAVDPTWLIKEPLWVRLGQPEKVRAFSRQCETIGNNERRKLGLPLFPVGEYDDEPLEDGLEDEGMHVEGEIDSEQGEADNVEPDEHDEPAENEELGQELASDDGYQEGEEGEYHEAGEYEEHLDGDLGHQGENAGEYDEHGEEIGGVHDGHDEIGIEHYEDENEGEGDYLDDHGLDQDANLQPSLDEQQYQQKLFSPSKKLRAVNPVAMDLIRRARLKFLVFECAQHWIKLTQALIPELKRMELREFNRSVNKLLLNSSTAALSAPSPFRNGHVPRTAAMMDAETLAEYNRRIAQLQQVKQQQHCDGKSIQSSHRVPFDSEKFKADMLQQLELMEEVNEGIRHRLWKPLDVPTLVGARLARTNSEAHEIFWKLIVYAEDDEDYLSLWLKSKLLRRRHEQARPPNHNNGTARKSIDLLSLYTADVLQQPANDYGEEEASEKQNEDEYEDDYGQEDDRDYGDDGSEDDLFDQRPRFTVPLHIVIKMITERGLSSPSLPDEMKGTHSLIFLLPLLDRKNPEKYWFVQKETLIELVRSMRSHAHTSLLIFYSCEQNEYFDEEAIRANLSLDLLPSETISRTHVAPLYIDRTPQCLDHNEWQVCAGLRWFATRTQKQPTQLHVYSLQDAFEIQLNAGINQVLQRQGTHVQPQLYVDIFNHCVDLFGQVIASPELMTFNWPAPEFFEWDKKLPNIHWNDEEHVQMVTDILAKSKIPKFSLVDYTPSEEEKLSHVMAEKNRTLKSIENYCYELAAKSITTRQQSQISVMPLIDKQLQFCENFYAIYGDAQPTDEAIFQMWYYVFMNYFIFRMEQIASVSSYDPDNSNFVVLSHPNRANFDIHHTIATRNELPTELLNELRSQRAEIQKEQFEQRVKQLQIPHEQVEEMESEDNNNQQQLSRPSAFSNFSPSTSTASRTTISSITPNNTNSSSFSTSSSSSTATKASSRAVSLAPLDAVAMTTPTRPTSMQGLQQELSRQFAVADAYLDVLVNSTESHSQFLKAYTQRLAQRKGRLPANYGKNKTDSKT